MTAAPERRNPPGRAGFEMAQTMGDGQHAQGSTAGAEVHP